MADKKFKSGAKDRRVNIYLEEDDVTLFDDIAKILDARGIRGVWRSDGKPNISFMARLALKEWRSQNMK